REVFPGLAKGGAGGPGGGGGGGGGNVLCRSCFHRDGGLGGKLVDVTGGDGGDDGGGGGGAAIGPVLFNYFGIVEITNSGATGSSATPGRGFASQGGKDGTADATPIFNYGGYVNHDTKQGPISGILLSHAPTAVPGQGP
ncbi:MAG TPA: hypothetical protein VNG31_07535, partial [Candidatus Baltobacteraceae bacterium]|nr:hypothetical protein [Candidatus Baltobacteraceae bacterium]